MTGDTPVRLRMFAGPNGSGKSSVVQTLAREFNPQGHFSLAHYVNADDLQRVLAGSGFDLSAAGIGFDPQPILESLRESSRFDAARTVDDLALVDSGRIRIKNCTVQQAAAFADFLREEFLRRRVSFSFETVMSHRNKVDFFRRARDAGYRTYLYFVATNNPLLNVFRVRHRAELGGHDVPAEKVISRYHRCLDLLVDAVRLSHRAYVFDNSGVEPQWIAETTPDGALTCKMPDADLPDWFRRHLRDRIAPSGK